MPIKFIGGRILCKTKLSDLYAVIGEILEREQLSHIPLSPVIPESLNYRMINDLTKLRLPFTTG